MMFDFENKAGDWLQVNLVLAGVKVHVGNKGDGSISKVIITNDQARALRDALTEMLGDGK